MNGFDPLDRDSIGGYLLNDFYDDSFVWGVVFGLCDEISLRSLVIKRPIPAQPITEALLLKHSGYEYHPLDLFHACRSHFADYVMNNNDHCIALESAMLAWAAKVKDPSAPLGPKWLLGRSCTADYLYQHRMDESIAQS